MSTTRGYRRTVVLLITLMAFLLPTTASAAGVSDVRSDRVAAATAQTTQSTLVVGAPALRFADENEDEGDGGILGDVLGLGCKITPGLGLLGLSEEDCGKITDDAAKKINKKIKDAWKAIKDSLFGDIIEAAKSAAETVVKLVLTVALMGPTLDLNDTGLFGPGSLYGMMMWLGLCIAALGLMWQLGKLAVTGQMRYAGQALKGFFVNALIVGGGLTVINVLLVAGDKLTEGLIDAAFDDQEGAVARIVAVMLPGVANPIVLALVVVVLLLVGAIQLILIFLREAAIPLQAMLLPVAGAGLMGGEGTQKWAPRLITSILTVIAYKPILGMIIAVGFTEFGKAATFTEFMRGLATLVLGVLAPGPLMKLFAPIGAEIGAGLSSGGAVGAAGAAGQYLSNRGGGGGGETAGGGGGGPATPVEQARNVEKSMPQQRQDGGGGQGGEASGGGDAVAQAARNTTRHAKTAAGAAATAGAGVAGAGAGSGAGAAGGTVRGAGSGRGQAGTSAGMTVDVLDGLRGASQGAANYIGEAGQGQGQGGQGEGRQQ